jgi:hypothetical protein
MTKVTTTGVVEWEHMVLHQMRFVPLSLSLSLSLSIYLSISLYHSVSFSFLRMCVCASPCFYFTSLLLILTLLFRFFFGIFMCVCGIWVPAVYYLPLAFFLFQSHVLHCTVQTLEKTDIFYIFLYNSTQIDNF